MYGPAGINDSTPAYLFQCDDMYAVTLDETGANIPTTGCYQPWRCVSKFALGVNDAVPATINPEPILRGLRIYGYYVWREGTARGEATTQ
jgi:hypothetical protein